MSDIVQNTHVLPVKILLLKKKQKQSELVTWARNLQLDSAEPSRMLWQCCVSWDGDLTSFSFFLG